MKRKKEAETSPGSGWTPLHFHDILGLVSLSRDSSTFVSARDWIQDLDQAKQPTIPAAFRNKLECSHPLVTFEVLLCGHLWRKAAAGTGVGDLGKMNAKSL